MIIIVTGFLPHLGQELDYARGKGQAVLGMNVLGIV